MEPVCRKCKTRKCLLFNAENEPDLNSPANLEPIFCSSCFDFFPNRACFAGHCGEGMEGMDGEELRLPVCKYNITCTQCGKRFPREPNGALPNHPCLIGTCRGCNITYDCSKGEQHLCTISKPSLRELGITKNWAQTLKTLTTPPTISEQEFNQKYKYIVGDVKYVFFDFEDVNLLFLR